MKIALDYDDTITRDPEFWKNVAIMARNKGHDIRIVTFRYVENLAPVHEFASSIGLTIIATGHVGKRAYCADIGWMPDVWIDDSPEFIVLEY